MLIFMILIRICEFFLEFCEIFKKIVSSTNYPKVVGQFGKDIAQLNAEFSMIKRSVTRKLQWVISLIDFD